MSSISKVAVLGAGTMGAGIAELCSARGVSVKLFDVAPAQCEAALSAIAARLDKRVAKGAMSADDAHATKARLSVSSDLTSAVAHCDLVIEAVPEDMALKVKVLAPVRDAAPRQALLASNTSSLSITELGRSLDAADRVVGLHFFNPPPVMPLIEIVRGLATSSDTLARASAFVSALGKEQIVVHDSPGFATSRLGVALGAEAIRMVETGVASVVDIDRAMELGYRHPMGPLKLTDLVGLDVRLSILDHLHREVGEQFRAPSLLRQMVRAGMTGKKSGRGFYVWTDDGPIPNPEILR